MHVTHLWRRNAFGIGTWQVYSMAVSATKARIIIKHASSEGGTDITHVDDVTVNKSGRGIDQQVNLEIQARISRQLDKGYKATREEALLGSTNQLGLTNPMLAQKLVDVTLSAEHFAEGNAFVQPKYDGHRCLITRINGEMLAYTRRGKEITTIGHILSECYRWMQDGDTIDGELYIHGQPLQAISSLIKRNQAGSRALTFRWYDIVDHKVGFNERYNLMVDLYANVTDTDHIGLCPTGTVTSMDQAYAFFRKCRERGYEGAMLRLSGRGYEANKRSSQLLKIKERHDSEVNVIGCTASARGWAVLRVTTDWGTEFDVAAPGSVAEKTEVLTNFEAKYLGRRLTVEYAGLTTDKIPFHCVATRWHEEL